MNKNGKENHHVISPEVSVPQPAFSGESKDGTAPCVEREQNCGGQQPGHPAGDRLEQPTKKDTAVGSATDSAMPQGVPVEGPQTSSECTQRSGLCQGLAEPPKQQAQERPFQCTQCEKGFIRNSDLIKHQRTHMGERFYICNECGKSFRRHTSLIIHERIHTGERPYKCTECGKNFIQRQHLTTHLKTHTGERPFPCTECGKGFRWRSELIKHQKVHTGYTRG
ncbi:zinc finger protein 436-like [Rhinatrema bivittatum]|uniref:zinc finger protein 436-like n=1 Tax=Rhinatrema bivittatum TaxID=194408 RepID=UPI00112B0F77|nr:zinc finger protein 436-like [Rhinatrema bivittatum]